MCMLGSGKTEITQGARYEDLQNERRKKGSTAEKQTSGLKQAAEKDRGCV
jgi:hypothetical protein